MVRSIFRAFWEELVAAYRAEKQGGQAAVDSRRHEAEMRAEFATLIADITDQREAERLAKRWVNAKTPAELEAVRKQLTAHILGTGKGS